MNKIAAFSLLLIVCETASARDPFDFSALIQQNNIAGGGVPTPAEIAALEAKGTGLFAAKDCTNALPVIERFGRRSNYFAALVTAGFEPYYRSSFREGFQEGGALAESEALALNYQRKRDLALVMMGECYAQLRIFPTAIEALQRALALIDIENVSLWQRARKDLYEIIEAL